MKRSRHFSLAPLLLAAACARQESLAAPEWAELVPPDAVALISVRSPAAVDQSVNRTSAALGEASPEDSMFDSAVAGAGYPWIEVPLDRRRGFGVVVSMDDTGARFPVTWIACFRHAEDRERLLAEPPAGFSVTAAGEYLALRDDGDRPEGPAPPELLANLDEGLISLSLDAARLLEKHRATAWIALGAAQNEIEAEMRAQPQTGAVDPVFGLDLFFDGIRKALEAAEFFSVRADWADELLELDARLAVREGSPMHLRDGGEAVDYAALFGRLEPDAAMRGVYSWGPWQSALAEFQRQPDIFGDQLSPEAEAAWARYFEAQSALMDIPTTGVGFQAWVGATGMRFAGFLDTAQGDAVSAAMRELIATRWLWDSETLETSPFAGLPAETWSLNVDFEAEAFSVFGPMERTIFSALLGNNPWLVRAVQSPGGAHIHFGGTDEEQERATRRMLSGGKPNPHDSALARKIAGTNPAMAACMDYRSLLAFPGMVEALRNEEGLDPGWTLPPDFAEGPDVPLGMYFGVAGTEWRAGLMLDLPGFMAMLAQLMDR